MGMRQLTPIHGQDPGLDCWKCTHCDQLFWTSNDSRHRQPPARVWTQFHQHSCETFQMIRQWLTEAVKRTSHDKAVTLQDVDSGQTQDQKSAAAQMFSRAGAFARRVVRSISTPGGIPSGNEILQRLPAEKPIAAANVETKSKAAGAASSH